MTDTSGTHNIGEKKKDEKCWFCFRKESRSQLNQDLGIILFFIKLSFQVCFCPLWTSCLCYTTNSHCQFEIRKSGLWTKSSRMGWILLYEETGELAFSALPHEDRTGRWPSANESQPSLTPDCDTLVLDILASKTVRDWCSLFEPPDHGNLSYLSELRHSFEVEIWLNVLNNK